MNSILITAALAAGLIDAGEAARLETSAAAVRHAIDVDDFAPDAFRRPAGEAAGAGSGAASGSGDTASRPAA